ncbi:MAG: cold-shock protein [Brevundimonas sp.]
MIEGTVKYIGADGRFGMISRDDKQPKVFVHLSEARRFGLAALEKGQRFRFELQTAEDGRTSARLIELI